MAAYPIYPSNVTAWSSPGSNLQYNNLCIAGKEETLPEGWKPIHVQLDFKRPNSVVGEGKGWSYISSVGEAQRFQIV